MTDHPVPKTQIDSLKTIIEGYYEAGAVGEEVEDEDVAEEIELSSDVIKRQKRFLADIGLLEKDGYDYTLLEEGHEVGRGLAFDRNDDAVEALYDLLDGWEVTEQLISDIDGEVKSEEELVDSLAYLTETDPNGRKKTGLTALVHLYRWVGILSQAGENKYKLSDPDTERSEDQTVEETSTPDVVEESGKNTPTTKSLSEPTPEEQVPGHSVPETTHKVQTEEGISGDITIDIELKGDDDPDNVQALLLAIRKGLHDDLSKESEAVSNGKSEEHKSLDKFES
ncbi:hypothetical protein [Haloarchaeobius litoreus]|uniref:Uncharacterized protein n=1 Tax=Haloarchaeobius litoreus TaxID=755306 RepID=A0ABD6DHF4_9EURY|nr:hypothetical protein [Haloarchaeobius litoreus]